jgi:hypothetical protein
MLAHIYIDAAYLAQADASVMSSCVIDNLIDSINQGPSNFGHKSTAPPSKKLTNSRRNSFPRPPHPLAPPVLTRRIPRVRASDGLPSLRFRVALKRPPPNRRPPHRLRNELNFPLVNPFVSCAGPPSAQSSAAPPCARCNPPPPSF